MEKIKAWWNASEGLSASTIKFIAVVSMVIDHTAAGVLGRYLTLAGIRSAYWAEDPAVWDAWMAQNGTLYMIYEGMRGIGRLAFPIYCYFLVEGLRYTRNVWKYLARLVLFALLSEVPFDLLFEGKVLEFTYQNVYFTLAIGLLVIIGMRWAGERFAQSRLWTAVLRFLILAAGCALAMVMRTDYSFKGVICIAVIYLFSQNKKSGLIATAAVFAWELPVGPLAAIPLAFYKKKRGLKLKYFFYAVYPVHLFLLYLLTGMLGIWKAPSL